MGTFWSTILHTISYIRTDRADSIGRSFYVHLTVHIHLDVKNIKFQIKNGRYNNRINSWLNDRTSCDISYTWVDLGIRWFPRFVMKGQCQNEVSCSIPSGMYCQPNEERRIQFYRLVMSSYLSSVAEVQAHGVQREWDRVVFGLVFRFAFGTIFMVSKRLQRVEERLVQKMFYPQLKGGNLIRSWPLVWTCWVTQSDKRKVLWEKSIERCWVFYRGS